MKSQWIHMIPILFLFLLVLFSKETIAFSNTIFGKLLSILLILYYSTIDRLYGLVLCLLIVLYYQEIDFLEGFDSYQSNNLNVLATPMMTTEYISPAEDLNTSIPEKQEFRQKYCHLGKLMHKGYEISKENAEFVFPSLQFSDMGPCDPCENACKYTIAEFVESDIKMIPKSSKEWFSFS
jgi:hypothetical protein